MVAGLRVVCTNDENVDPFTDFWTLYPRHIAKKDAQKAWAHIASTEHTAILVALVGWRRVWIKRDEMEYVPYPASWLRGERWEDELPATKGSGPIHASHVQAAVPQAGERTVMPEHVRALIAKLRG